MQLKLMLTLTIKYFLKRTKAYEQILEELIKLVKIEQLKTLLYINKLF
jgi:hypothetical protein